jgi:soluble lytic murein transglycosylase-like protein
MKILLTTLILSYPVFAGELDFLNDLPQIASAAFRLPDEHVAVKPRPATALASLPLVFPKDPHALIREAALKHNVPAAFVKSIVAAESNFQADALSPKGAIGFMQLMPETAQLFGADPNIPEQNIDAGTRYLRWLMNRYRNYRDSLHRVIAAYNAGPGMVDRYRGVPPFPETRVYVARVLSFLRQFEHARG